MLEILFLTWFARHIGETVRVKGYAPGGYRFLAVLSWIGGEMLGLLVGSALTQGPAVYLVGLAGAVLGAATMQQIAARKRNLAAIDAVAGA
jgi:hypothetical protein